MKSRAFTLPHPRFGAPAPNRSSKIATSSAAFLLLIAGTLLHLAAAGCREEGRWYACSCTFLTDFDDPSGQRVEVCAPSADRAPAVAKGCAQTAAPAPVQGCACSPKVVAEGASAVCSAGDCQAP